MFEKIFELDPFLIDLLCNTLGNYLDLVDSFACFLECEEPSLSQNELEAFRNCLSLVRHDNDSTNCGYFSLEIVKKWHSQID